MLAGVVLVGLYFGFQVFRLRRDMSETVQRMELLHSLHDKVDILAFPRGSKIHTFLEKTN